MPAGTTQTDDQVEQEGHRSSARWFRRPSSCAHGGSASEGQIGGAVDRAAEHCGEYPQPTMPRVAGGGQRSRAAARTKSPPPRQRATARTGATAKARALRAPGGRPTRRAPAVSTLPGKPTTDRPAASRGRQARSAATAQSAPDAVVKDDREGGCMLGHSPRAARYARAAGRAAGSSGLGMPDQRPARSKGSGAIPVTARRVFVTGLPSSGQRSAPPRSDHFRPPGVADRRKTGRSSRPDAAGWLFGSGFSL